MKDDDDINNYLPSILNPRGIKKQEKHLLTQESVISRRSLSLNRTINVPTVKRNRQITSPKKSRQEKENIPHNENLPIIRNVPGDKNSIEADSFFFSVEDLNTGAFNDDFSFGDTETPKKLRQEKENIPHNENLPIIRNIPGDKSTIEAHSFFFSAEDLNTGAFNEDFSFGDTETPKKSRQEKENIPHNENLPIIRNVPGDKSTIEADSFFFSVEDLITGAINDDFSFGDTITPNFINDKEIENGEIIDVDNGNVSLKTESSATELYDPVQPMSENSSKTLIPNYLVYQNVVSVSFGITDCDTVNLSTKNSNIKKIMISHKANNTNIDCEMMEDSVISISSDTDEEECTPPKKKAVTVNLEIKKKQDRTENTNVLILKSDAIDKVSHVCVTPNFKLVKRKFFDRCKFKSSLQNEICANKTSCGVSLSKSNNLKQSKIVDYLKGSLQVGKVCVKPSDNVGNDNMNKNLGVGEAVNKDRLGRISLRAGVSRKENEVSPRPIKLLSKREVVSPKLCSVKVSSSEVNRAPPHVRNSSAGSQSPTKSLKVDSLQFALPNKSRSHRIPVSPRHIPHYKIVAGTHFAVDAFSYGDIPSVKHYFLTHFHSDHYSGLKKGFNKILYCSKITADLCVSRLGVNVKCIQEMGFDETIFVEGVEVTAVDANHCPGALMLLFTLPSGKTLLHTGDFRASPLMESYPAFWNKDVHTIYLDTTYCNPRYDFPTQDQSLELALYLLRQKKLALEKVGKKFSSVLIVCGTYTIGKEKFFLGMARRVGCSVWACPEKDRVLQSVEGRSFNHAPAHSCQLHVVPMRDLTHEKLRAYLESLQDTFSEVVAFKPSGWENAKGTAVEKDMVTIHGIPYSEHSSFSELIRFVTYLKPKQVVPTVDISGGVKSVQKYFPCPMIGQDEALNQSKLTDFYSIQNRQQVPAVT